MKKISILVLGFILLFGLLFVVVRSNQGEAREVKIGMIAGLTGPYAFIGENYVKGAQLALEELKENDPSLTATLIVENDDFDSKKSLSAYEKLIGVDQVNALISETTATIEAIYDRVTKIGIPVIQGGEQSIDPIDDNVIQIQPGYYQAEVSLGEHVKGLGKKNVAVFVQNYPAMLRFFRGFEEGFGKEGINQFLVNFGDKDLRNHALKAFTTKPDAIVFLMFPDDGALLVKELNTLYRSGQRPQYVFDANFQAGVNNYKNILGDLTILDQAVVSIVQQEMDEDFVTRYEKRWGQKPAVGSEYGYDAVVVLVKNYDQNTSAWTDKIKSGRFEGVSGLVRFDEVGVRIPDFKKTTIKDGEIIY